MLYTVRPGDTLGEIARRFGTTLGALRAANPSITDVHRIRVRQRLRVPLPGDAVGQAAVAGPDDDVPFAAQHRTPEQQAGLDGERAPERHDGAAG
jgi:LysM repeat protein